MAQRRFRTNVVVSYQPDDYGWTRAMLPGMPGVVTAGVSREDAREMVIDSLMQLLAAEPDREAGADYERVRLDVAIGQSVQHDTARGRGRRGGTAPTSAGRPAPTDAKSG
jgi:predicted RNase H-like HicB family nuclease